MKAQNTLVKKEEKKSFSAVISGEGAQKLIRASLRDEASVKRFTGTLISVVNASQQLSQCNPGSIISAALRGEGAGLIYGHGYYVVPYGDSATYITGYKGYIQLALATGLYADIDCIEVREGERKGRDRRTGKPVVDLSVYDTDEEREQHKIIGYKAYFELKDGYFREEYWSLDELLRHADRYSKAFSRDLYMKWQSGEALTKDEAYTVQNGSPWYTSTDRMCRKTVLRSLLNSGFAPLSNEVKSLLNKEAESGEGDVLDLGSDVIPDYTVDESTGEVIDVTPAEPAQAPETHQEPPKDETPADATDKPRRGRPPKKQAEESQTNDFPADDADDEAVESFFAGVGAV